MNPIAPHASKLFADRDTIEQAMQYANTLLNSITDGQDKIAAWTALMVVVNTAAKVWPEADTPAVPDDGLRSRVAALEEALHSTARVGWTRDELTELVQSELSTWADDSFNDLADDWLRNHADLDDSIQNWMENNMDVENEVREVLSSANLSITF